MANRRKDGEPVLTAKRQRVIAGLQRLGGKIEANGKGLLAPEEVEKLIGERCAPMFLQACERDGILTRVVHGRRTKSIALTKKYMERKAATAVEPVMPEVIESSRPTRRNKKQISTPMPVLGANVEVFMQVLDRDGTVHVGFRTESQSWLTVVEGHTNDT